MTIPLIGITSDEKPGEGGGPIIHLSVSTLFADGVKKAGGQFCSPSEFEKLAPHLKVTARSSEDEVIEGVESFTDAPFIGVQWHLEFLLGHKQLADQGLFDYFVKSFK